MSSMNTLRWLIPVALALSAGLADVLVREGRIAELDLEAVTYSQLNLAFSCNASQPPRHFRRDRNPAIRACSDASLSSAAATT